MKLKIGNDTTFCIGNLEDGIEIASQLFLEGGVPPYTYTWSCERLKIYEARDKVFYTGSFLNDTTLANPRFISSIPDMKWHKFVLEVTDDEGNTAKDSINVRFSEFYAVILAEVPIYVEEGDSILLKAEDRGGIHPYRSYSWTPTNNLSNPNDSVTWCKPDKETRYYCDIVDAAGCSDDLGGNSFWIIMIPKTSVAIPELNSEIYQKGEFICFPNENNGKIIISFYDLSGSLITQGISYANKYKPDLQILPPISVCIIDNGKEKKTIKYNRL